MKNIFISDKYFNCPLTLTSCIASICGMWRRPAPHKYWINDESGLKGVKMRSQYFLKLVSHIKRIHNFSVNSPKSLRWEKIRVVVIEIWIWRSVLILSLTSVVLEAVGGRVWFEELVWDWHPIPSQPSQQCQTNKFHLVYSSRRNLQQPNSISCFYSLFNGFTFTLTFIKELQGN